MFATSSRLSSRTFFTKPTIHSGSRILSANYRGFSVQAATAAALPIEVCQMLYEGLHVTWNYGIYESVLIHIAKIFCRFFRILVL